MLDFVLSFFREAFVSTLSKWSFLVVGFVSKLLSFDTAFDHDIHSTKCENCFQFPCLFE